MPEIAEVETVRRLLQKKVLNKRIKSVNVLYERIIESDLGDFKKNLIGLEFKDILRKGKWLLFDVGDYYLCSHLRMEGKYFVKESNEPIEKHEHVIISFDDGTDLRYHDTRKFGRMNLVLKKDIDNYQAIKKQGYEPNDEKLTAEYLHEKINKTKLPIKTLLLDQTIISGLGNIYANEVLFGAKVNPFKLGCNISLEECFRIITSANEIIKEAIKCGGTTIRSYTSSLGVTGSYQNYLKVHGRNNENCFCCGGIIQKGAIGGRSTYYCEKCQNDL